jgi:hypothetical protein
VASTGTYLQNWIVDASIFDSPFTMGLSIIDDE